MSSNDVAGDPRVHYCREKKIHHLFELLAAKVLVDRPDNPYAYLRQLLQEVEDGENKPKTYDPTQIGGGAAWQAEKLQRESHSTTASRGDDNDTTPANGSSSGSSSASSSASPSSSSSSAATTDKGESTTVGTSGDGAGAAEAASSQPSQQQQPSHTPRRITIAVLGIDNAGKTATVSLLSGSVDKDTTPTVGFNPTTFTTAEGDDVTIFDLGGGGNFRGIWQHYFHDCHGFIFVVDAASSEEKLAEATKCFAEIMQHPYMCGKPFLVLANKKDLPNARPLEVVREQVVAPALQALQREESSSSSRSGSSGPPLHRIVSGCAIEEDPAVEGGIEWLLTEGVGSTDDAYRALAERVKADTAQVKIEKQRRLEEQRARVAARQAAEAAGEQLVEY